MIPYPTWLPPLIHLGDFDGVWDPYENAVYEKFCADLVWRTVAYRGRKVAVRRHPETHGKGFGFWHCVQEGAIEAERTPDMSRCERIAWIRAIIENATDENVDHWTNQRDGFTNHILWFREEYLVVLSERTPKDGDPYFLLKTAYCTTREHSRRKLRTERDAWEKANAAL